MTAIYNCHIFIHLDKKSWSIKNEITEENITFVPYEKSIDVSWGTFSQCVATLTLINQVVDSKESYDYLWLISGQDLPIADAKTVSNYFFESKIPYIEVINLQHEMYPAFEKRNDLYYHNIIKQNKTYSRVLKIIYHLITGGRRHTYNFVKRRKNHTNYYGSAWWCLPWECVKEMLTIIEKTDCFINYFKYSLYPDESFFQTIFMQTSFAGKQREILTYINWNNCASNPHVFDGSDFELLREKSKKFLLARKFDVDKDTDICEKVLKELCNLH